MSILPPDVEDSALVENVKGKKDWYVQESRATRRQWLINAAFSRGQQFSILHKNDDKLLELREPPGRKQVMIDKIGPWKKNMVANLVAALPVFNAQPTSLDGDDVSASRAADGLLTYYWQHWKFQLDAIKVAAHLCDFGNAYIYLNYVEDGTRVVSEPLRDAITDEPVYGDDGQPMLSKRSVGDVTATVLSPHYVMTPLDECDLEDKPWVIVAQKRPLDYFVNTYKNGKDVKPEEEITVGTYELSRIAANERVDEANKLEYANELIYFQKPNKVTNKDGIIAVVANGVLLDKQVWPFKKLMTYPIEHFHMAKEAGEFLARSPIEPQIPIQKALNLVISGVLENSENMAHIKTLIPMQAGIKTPSNYNEILRYTHPFKPEYMTPSSMPMYILDVIGLLQMAMADVQSFHGSSQGGSQSGVRSDVHAQNLQDQDLLPMSVVDNIMAVSYERMAEKVLLIAAEKLSDERILQYIGKDKRIMVQKFKGSMLRDVRNVKVSLSNTWTRSRASVTQNVIQLAQIGAFTDEFGQVDNIRIMRLLEHAIPNS
jgi:hypothetical protein